MIDVTVILSELSDVAKVRDYYSESTSFIHEVKRKQEEAESKLRVIDETAKDVPTLL